MRDRYPYWRLFSSHADLQVGITLREQFPLVTPALFRVWVADAVKFGPKAIGTIARFCGAFIRGAVEEALAFKEHGSIMEDAHGFKKTV